MNMLEPKNVILMGDFNARTSDLHDFSDIDKKLYEDIDIDENVSSDAVDEITKYSHDIKSISNDNKRNKFGKNLIESCKIQSTLVISTSVISNNRLSRRKNLVLV